MGTVTQSIVVNAPISQVFAFWKNFENFPRFMDNIENIQVIGQDMTHWKTKGPLGTAIEWDAKTTYVEENKKIAWQSVDGQIENHGAVTFKELAPEQTEVTVGIEYQPPGGVLGEAVARLFSDPEDQLVEDLKRFKEVAESGDFAMISGHATSGSGQPNAAAYTGGSESTLIGEK